MYVKVYLYPERFEVRATYVPEMVEFFKWLDSRFWNAEKKSWSFPNKHLPEVQDYLKEFNVVYKDRKSPALAFLTQNELYIKYKFQPDEEIAFQEKIPEAICSLGSDEWCIPKKDYGTLKKFLEDNWIQPVYASHKIEPFLEYIANKLKNISADTSAMSLESSKMNIEPNKVRYSTDTSGVKVEQSKFKDVVEQCGPKRYNTRFQN